MKAEGTAMVTGAGRGIGRAVAVDLARAGFDVVATMREPAAGDGLADEVAGGAGSIRVARLDVVDPATVEIPEGLTVLVNNAATELEYLPLEHTPMDHWRQVFETNVFGLVEVTRRAIPVMRQGGGGVICNITSSSLVLGVPFYAVYRASKAAVQAIGETLATEVAPFGIRVVEILPGPVESDMLAQSDRPREAAAFPEYAELARRSYEERHALTASTPAAEAAAAIRQAILTDDGPLRWPCDELGGHLLAAWQRRPDDVIGALIDGAR
ncbi:MAG TPA: SDR family NAD(P)-dependent oxidoreductase [Acidimicrobiales bacterium]|nr:SDR family NAD(P)-dependent oxidoreductase [Acidimicrobiales bacterium]